MSAAPAPGPGLDALLRGVLAGEPRALARAISLVENAGPGSEALLASLAPHAGRARVVGVTGPPGAGKSTLVGALIGELRRRGRTVAVLAVDPSSPVSGGAILGDRLRMGAHAADPGVFVRSIASRGHLGGLFRTASSVLRVIDASGPDFVVVETVGAGQSEVEVAGFAHTRVVLCAPGAGDDVQAIKAGILEIADVLVVNKADHPQAAQAVEQLEAMLALRAPDAPATRVLATVATTGRGVAALADLLEAPPSQGRAVGRAPGAHGRRLQRQALADAAARALRDRVLAGDEPALERLCERLERGEIGIGEAVRAVLGAV